MRTDRWILGCVAAAVLLCAGRAWAFNRRRKSTVKIPPINMVTFDDTETWVDVAKHWGFIPMKVQRRLKPGASFDARVGMPAPFVKRFPAYPKAKPGERFIVTYKGRSAFGAKPGTLPPTLDELAAKADLEMTDRKKKVNMVRTFGVKQIGTFTTVIPGAVFYGEVVDPDKLAAFAKKIPRQKVGAKVRVFYYGQLAWHFEPFDPFFSPTKLPPAEREVWDFRERCRVRVADLQYELFMPRHVGVEPKYRSGKAMQYRPGWTSSLQAKVADADVFNGYFALQGGDRRKVGDAVRLVYKGGSTFELAK